MDADHFRAFVVRPALLRLGLHSAAAETLLVGTALVESGGLRWLRQRGGGPALGLFQIEPATHDDVWTNFLRYRDPLADKAAAFAAPWPSRHEQLITNPAYACVVARLIYYRAPAPLPKADDLVGLARYWKAHYNTALGAGTVPGFLKAYSRFVTRRRA